MPPVGFEPTISAGERPQTYPLDRAATGPGIYIGIYFVIVLNTYRNYFNSCMYLIINYTILINNIKAGYLHCFEDGQDWPKREGTNLYSVLLYIYSIVY